MIRKSRAEVRALKGVYLALLLAFLYLPILVMFGLSFNKSVSRAEWTGFTLDWYVQLFHDPSILKALATTIEVALIATFASVIIGTLGAVGMHSMSRGWFNLLSAISNIPMTMPDIVTGVSLMLMFIFVNVTRGKLTMILAHIAFCIPYVMLSVLPRLQMMNPNNYDAALDLGCTPTKALCKVIIPEIVPGIVTGGLLSFTMSLDDFVISYFTSDTDVNLAMLIYSSARKGVEPTMYALSALMFICILVLLLIVNRRSGLELF